MGLGLGWGSGSDGARARMGLGLGWGSGSDGARARARKRHVGGSGRCARDVGLQNAALAIKKKLARVACELHVASSHPSATATWRAVGRNLTAAVTSCQPKPVALSSHSGTHNGIQQPRPLVNANAPGRKAQLPANEKTLARETALATNVCGLVDAELFQLWRCEL